MAGIRGNSLIMKAMLNNVALKKKKSRRKLIRDFQIILAFYPNYFGASNYGRSVLFCSSSAFASFNNVCSSLSSSPYIFD